MVPLFGDMITGGRIIGAKTKRNDCVQGRIAESTSKKINTNRSQKLTVNSAAAARGGVRVSGSNCRVNTLIHTHTFRQVQTHLTQTTLQMTYFTQE